MQLSRLYIRQLGTFWSVVPVQAPWHNSTQEVLHRCMNQTPAPVFLDLGLSNAPVIQWKTQISVDTQSVADFSVSYAVSRG